MNVLSSSCGGASVSRDVSDVDMEVSALLGESILLDSVADK